MLSFFKNKTPRLPIKSHQNILGEEKMTDVISLKSGEIIIIDKIYIEAAATATGLSIQEGSPLSIRKLIHNRVNRYAKEINFINENDELIVCKLYESKISPRDSGFLYLIKLKKIELESRMIRKISLAWTDDKIPENLIQYLTSQANEINWSTQGTLTPLDY